MTGDSNTASGPKLVYLRQWVGKEVLVMSEIGREQRTLTNIVFDGSNKLQYIVLDDAMLINFDAISAILLIPEKAGDEQKAVA